MALAAGTRPSTRWRHRATVGVAAVSATLCLSALLGWIVPSSNQAWREAVSANVAKGMLVIVPAALVLHGLTPAALVDLAFGLIAVYAATAIFYRIQPGLTQFPIDAGRWVRQAIVVGATSFIALGTHYASMPDPLSVLGELLEFTPR
jgi:uncharacterized BrkB/YihY/UPF0761 family membrane protein